MKRHKVKDIVNGLTALLCVALLVFLVVNLITVYPDKIIEIIISVLVGAVVTIFINSVIHELGHVLFGAIAGLKVYSVQFLNLFIGIENGKFKIKFKPLASELGETVLLPKNTQNVAKKFVISSVGGLLFSLLLIIAQVLIVLLVDNAIIEAGLGATFPITAYVFLINLFPLFENNDGCLVYNYLAGGERKVVLENYYKCVALLVGGTEPSELDGALLLRYDGCDGYHAYIDYLRYLAYVKNDEESAIKELRKLSDLSKVAYLNDEIFEEMFFASIILNDDKFIKAHAEEAVEIVSLQERPQSYRIHASYRIYNGEGDWAKLILESGIKYCDTYAIKGIATAERKYMEAMLNNLK